MRASKEFAKKNAGDVFVAWVSAIFSRLYYIEHYDLIIYRNGYENNSEAVC